MNKTVLLSVVVLGASSVVGFIVGFGIGKETRDAAQSNVKTGYSGGVLTIEANIEDAAKAGFTNWLNSL